MKSIRTLKNLKGKYILLRVGYDVPLKGTKVVDDVRIRTTIPTIEYLKKKGARIILLSHIGRDPKLSLLPVARKLNTYTPVTFVSDIFGDIAMKAREKMKNGDALLLENLRSHPGEKAGNLAFARALSKLGDIYVNDAFLVSHRGDASITQLPKLLPSFAGLQLEKEIMNLSKALKPKHPFLFILGGAKVETKLPLLRRYLKTADTVFVGGALVNNFFKSKGYEIGKSVVDTEAPSVKPLLSNKRLHIPEYVVIENKEGKSKTVHASDVSKNDTIVDIGVPSIEELSQAISRAKLIIWNGPMGWYEGGYTKGTKKLLDLLIKAKGDVIIGGGDTSVLVEKKKLSHAFNFVSTGGGATLDFLAKGTLPGIRALE